MIGGFATKDDFKDKYVFWDVDGVLAPYRWNDRICPSGNAKEAVTQEIVNTGVFTNRNPCGLVQRIIREVEAKRHIVLGRIVFDGEIEQKMLWLDENYPMIKDRLWASMNMSKGLLLRGYLEERDICVEDAIFIDDNYRELIDVELNYGVKSVHISSLLNWEDNR